MSDFREAIAREIALSVSEGMFVDPEFMKHDTMRCEIMRHFEELDADVLNMFYEEENVQTSEEETKEDGSETA